MRLYVIGPVSGHERDNREAFEEARRERGVCGQLGIPHRTVGEWCAEGAAS